MLTRQVIYSLIFKQPALKVLFWISLGSFGFHQSFHGVKLSWAVVVTRYSSLGIESARGARDTAVSGSLLRSCPHHSEFDSFTADLRPGGFSPIAVFAEDTSTLGSSTDLSSVIHVDKSLISYRHCRSNIQRRLHAILGSWKAHALLD